jgi:uncharacterized protein YdhG (YjbR/CyaY superfamily)
MTMPQSECLAGRIWPRMRCRLRDKNNAQERINVLNQMMADLTEQEQQAAGELTRRKDERDSCAETLTQIEELIRLNAPKWTEEINLLHRSVKDDMGQMANDPVMWRDEIVELDLLVRGFDELGRSIENLSDKAGEVHKDKKANVQRLIAEVDTLEQKADNIRKGKAELDGVVADLRFRSGL